MEILVLGGGGREHALVWRLAGDEGVTRLHCAPGNPGIAELAVCHAVDPEDPAAVVELAGRLGVDLVVVGPEAPLAAGVVDALMEAGIAAFGPTRAAAQVETSKAFAKQLMDVCGIPTAAYGVFEDFDEAEGFILRHGGPLVVKANGLYAGKGVVMARSSAEAVEAARSMLVSGEFGQAGARIVIEEYLEGAELSVIAICDGRRALALAPARDHKAAYDGDQGPNTGGMGAFSPVPGCAAGLVAAIEQSVLTPAVAGLAAMDCEFRGALYAGLMLTVDGPKVLEFNARFGDPEAQVLLPRLRGPLAKLLLAAARGDLSGAAPDIGWDERSAVCVVMASPGYPGRYPRGIQLGGLRAAEATPAHPPGGEVVVFQAGTAAGPGGRLVSAGGRVLGVTALAGGLPQAVDLAYQAVGRVTFPEAHYRTDIGRPGATR